MIVRAPASSANLGPGFDALGMALGLYLDVTGAADAPADFRLVDDGHPAAKAHRAAGGSGSVAIRTDIPAGRGLGFSGAARGGGALLAYLDQGLPLAEARAKALPIAWELEGHGDNAGPSLYGGVVATAADTVVRVPLGFSFEIVAWWPPVTTTSTKASRKVLPTEIPFADAVFNIGRACLLTAALAAGDTSVLRTATEDRLHQDRRLAEVPTSRVALDAALANGAICAWLSGSGPTIAALVAPGAASTVLAALPESGTACTVALDLDGARPVDS